MKPTETEIQKAKKVLEEAGYFVDNLWHVDDVKNGFECTDDEAQSILHSVLHNEYTIQLINEQIDEEAALEFPRKEEEY